MIEIKEIKKDNLESWIVDNIFGAPATLVTVRLQHRLCAFLRYWVENLCSESISSRVWLEEHKRMSSSISLAVSYD